MGSPMGFHIRVYGRLSFGIAKDSGFAVWIWKLQGLRWRGSLGFEWFGGGNLKRVDGSVLGSDSGQWNGWGISGIYVRRIGFRASENLEI